MSQRPRQGVGGQAKVHAPTPVPSGRSCLTLLSSCELRKNASTKATCSTA